jgi:rod shape-determining protein MreB and related proteins
VAVISLGGIVASRSLRVGGYDLDEAILAHIRRRHNIAIGPPTAERIKFDLGSAHPLEPEVSAEVRGLHLVSGLPERVVLKSTEIREALGDLVQSIVDAVRETLEAVPPELSADMATRGMTLAGGGSLLRGLDARLEAETGMDVHLVDAPLTCVAAGAGRSLEELDAVEKSGAGRRRGRRRSPGASSPRFRDYRDRSTA